MSKLNRVPVFVYYDAVFLLLVISLHKIILFQSTLSVLFLLGFGLTLLEIGLRILIRYHLLEGLSSNFIPLFVCAAVLENLYVFTYFIRERAIHFWDSSLYWSTSIVFTNNLFSNFSATIKMLYSSILNDDYNMVPSIVLSLPLKLFGYSYSIYALSIFNLYLLPVLFLITLLIRKILKDNDQLTNYSLTYSIIVPFLFTPFLIPLMSGYLDASGMYFAILLLILIYSDRFENIDVYRDLVFTFLLIMLLLTRRWYAYFAIGLIASFGLMSLIRILIESKAKKLKSLIFFIINMVVIGLSTLLVLTIFFRSFLVRSLFNNYSQTYSAYQSGTYIKNLFLLFQYIGPLLILIILPGIVFFYLKKRNSYFGSGLLLMTIISFSLFVQVQSLGVQHYYILALPLCLFLTTGICQFLVFKKKKWINLLFSIVFGFILMWNFFQIFEPGLSSLRNSAVLSNAAVYPVVRTDIKQINDMVNYLKHLTDNNGKKVYVLSSSAVLNGSIVSNADMPRELNALPSILMTHDVDLRDGFPNNFFLADYVVTTDPVQFHLQPENQKVVGALNNFVRQNLGSFRLQRIFYLDGEVKAYVYKRVDTFNKRSLEDLHSYFESSYPGHQLLTNINQLSPLIDENHLGDQHMQVWDDNGVLMMDCWNSRKLTVPVKLKGQYNKISFAITNTGDSVKSRKILLTLYFDGKKSLKTLIVGNQVQKLNLDVKRVREMKMVFQVFKSSSADNPMSFTGIKVH